MARSRMVDAEKEESDGRARGGWLRHLLLTLVLLAAIAYVAVFLAARTDGFRSTMEERLESVTGLKLSIGSVRATPSLDLVLTKVSSEGGPVAGAPGLYVGEASIRWSLAAWVTPGGSAITGLGLKEPYLSFRRSEDGGWEPPEMNTLALKLATWAGFEWPLSSPVASVPKSRTKGSVVDFTQNLLSGDVAVRFGEGRVAWWDRCGEQLAGLEGVSLDISPVRVRSRSMAYHWFTASHGTAPDGRRLEEYALEFIRTGGETMILQCSGTLGSRRSDRAVSPPEGAAAGLPNAVAEGDSEDRALAGRIRAELQNATK